MGREVNERYGVIGGTHVMLFLVRNWVTSASDGAAVGFVG